MRLLIITQAVDRNDTTLGFFHRWIEEFAKRVESVEVICLRTGEYDLPKHVRIFSLGKEKIKSSDNSQQSIVKKRGKIGYTINFYKYIWNLRNDYDAVFVHMNQEYVLLGGLLWKLLGKKIFFWRNHPHGDFGTQVAAAFSDKVFCTSKHSFTARFSKTEIMPAGIDTELFTHHTSHITHRVKNSLLMFGRVAPVKRIEIALETLALLKQKGIECTLSIVGDVLAKNQSYFQILKDRAEMLGIDSLVRFDTGVPFAQAPHIYSQHEIFLNFTPSGSFDKTVIEALACGTKVLVSNESMKKILPTGSFTTEHVEHVANNVERLMMLTEQELIQYNTEASDVVRAQSLSLLMEKLVDSFATK